MNGCLLRAVNSVRLFSLSVVIRQVVGQSRYHTEWPPNFARATQRWMVIRVKVRCMSHPESAYDDIDRIAPAWPGR